MTEEINQIPQLNIIRLFNRNVEMLVKDLNAADVMYDQHYGSLFSVNSSSVHQVDHSSSNYIEQFVKLVASDPTVVKQIETMDPSVFPFVERAFETVDILGPMRRLSKLATAVDNSSEVTANMILGRKSLLLLWKYNLFFLLLAEQYMHQNELPVERQNKLKQSIFSMQTAITKCDTQYEQFLLKSNGDSFDTDPACGSVIEYEEKKPPTSGPDFKNVIDSLLNNFFDNKTDSDNNKSLHTLFQSATSEMENEGFSFDPSEVQKSMQDPDMLAHTFQKVMNLTSSKGVPEMHSLLTNMVSMVSDIYTSQGGQGGELDDMVKSLLKVMTNTEGGDSVPTMETMQSLIETLPSSMKLPLAQMVLPMLSSVGKGGKTLPRDDDPSSTAVSEDDIAAFFSENMKNLEIS